MRQQPITDDSFSEAEAMRIVRGLTSGNQARALRDGGRSHAREVLASTMQDEVIPRLLASLQRAHGAPSARDGTVLGPHHVNELVGLLLRGTQPQAAAYVEQLHACGVGADALILDLLARSAHRLGEMWENDLCDFTEVTLGVMRLSTMMRLVSSAFDTATPPADDAPGILLVQAPGEQHGLGLAMVGHFFRRAGWQVRAEPVITQDELIDIVSGNWFAVVGISVSCSDHLDRLTRAIAALRAASCNPAIGVMVGGAPFIDQPGMVASVGADGTAADGRLAVEQAHILLARHLRDKLAAGEG